MDHTLAQLGVWILFWEILAFSTKSARYYIYGTWTVLCYWVTVTVTKGFHVDFLGYPYLVFSIFCAVLPLVIGSVTFLVYIRDYITVKTKPIANSLS
jgi:hypothetical protein